MKVTKKSNNGHPLEYHVGDVIESMGVEAYLSGKEVYLSGKEIIAHYLVIEVGDKYGLFHIEGNRIETHYHKCYKPFLTNTLEELYDKDNDPDDILVDAELVIK